MSVKAILSNHGDESSLSVTDGQRFSSACVSSGRLEGTDASFRRHHHQPNRMTVKPATIAIATPAVCCLSVPQFLKQSDATVISDKYVIRWYPSLAGRLRTEAKRNRLQRIAPVSLSPLSPDGSSETSRKVLSHSTPRGEAFRWFALCTLRQRRCHPAPVRRRDPCAG